MSPAMRAPAPEVEARVFPRSVLPPGVSATSSTASLLTGNTPTTALFNPLTNYPVADQQTILMRELLLILSGIEGHYIRVAAVPSSNPVPPGTVPMTTSGLTGTPPPALTINPHQHLPKLPEIKLVIDMDNADRSTASQVNQLLIICEYVIKIRAFITQQTRYEYGYISHALCAGMKEILSEFHILLCQLEYLLNISKLTLQKMIFLLQSSKIVLQILEKLCYSVKELIGGELLNVMYQLYLEQGDMKAKEIYGYLLTKAFQPFLNMLSLWIFRGELHDPYHEFMIAEDITISKESLQEDFNAQYWDTRYTLAAKHIPKILSMMSSSSLSSTATTSTSTTQSFAQKILITGKYLNVVRDCLHTMGAIASAGRKEDDGVHHAGMEGGKSRHHRYELPESVPLTLDFLLPQGMIGSKSTTNPSSFFTNPTAIASAATTSAVPPATSTVITASHSREYTTLFTHINRAYSTASALLLQLLQQEYSLSSHFVSLHHFFLLEHGDFFIQFMDIAEEELSKDVQDISLLHLQQLLMLSVQTSTLSNDEHKEDLFCSLASHNLIQHLHLIQMAGESSSSEFYSNMKNQQNNGSSTSLSSSSSTSNRLKGMEAFTLDYHVGWPLSIVLSRRVITKYQLLSRLLYFSKHVERRLLTTWMSHQTCKELLALAHRYTRRSSTRGGGGGSDADDSSNQLPAEQRSFITNVQQLFALRHRMLHFIQNFVYYITLEVIYPHHHEFFAHLHGTTTEYTNLPSMMHDEGGGEEEGEEGEEDGARGSMSGGDGMGTAGGGNGGKGTINIQDMDAILEIHEKFLDICLKECLLASQDLLKILMKLMTTCLLFTDHMIKFMADIQSLIHQTTPSTGGGRSGAGGGRGYQEEENVFTVPAAGAASSSSAASSPNKDSQISKKAKKFQQFYNSRQEKMQEYTYLLQQEIQQEAFQRILQKFMLTFDSQLKEFLTNLWTNSYRHHVQLANLCVRLDYNGYYTQHFTPSMSSSGGGGGGGGGGGSSYSTL